MVVAKNAIHVTGLSEFARSLRAIDADLARQLRLAGNEAAGLVSDWARARVEVDSGRAQRSIRATSTRTEARVSGGGARVPYYPFLDFGGRVGRGGSVEREFIRGGRYIYPGYAVNAERVQEALVAGLVGLVERAGLAVTGE